MLCVITNMDNMMCVEISCYYMLFDVLTWIAWMLIICKNYNYPWCINVSCSTHIYTCNIKEIALASCISYALSHRVESGVGAW